MMARRVKISRIKKNLTYSIVEAAEELGMSIATIRNWVKQGLSIQKDQRPYLIYGSDLRYFIAQKNKARKFTLQVGELNCFTCKTGRKPQNGAVTYTHQTAKTGRLCGVCCVCGGKAPALSVTPRSANFHRYYRFNLATVKHPKRYQIPQVKLTLQKEN